MRAADLLVSEAVDTRGRRLGKVHDITLVRPAGGAGGPWRVDTLIVGPSALAYRFGYAEKEVVGPAPLVLVARLMTRRRRRIAWSDVVAYGEGRIVVRAEGGDGR